MAATKSSARAPRALVLVHSYYVRDTRPRRHAPALAAAGWEVDVLCARDEGEPRREVRDGVRILRLPSRRRRGTRARYIFEYVSFAVLALVAATGLHSRRRYDAVYVIGIPNFLVFAALAPRLTGARVLLDMRDPLPEFFQAKYGLGARHPVIRLFRLEERLSSRFATEVLTVHPSMAALYARTGLPPERITVVWNAPDPRLFHDGAAPERDRDPADRTMLYAGTVAPRYGVDLAVRAVGRLAGEIPGLRLRVIGDGDLTERCRALAAEAGVAGRVLFEKPVPLDAIPGIVRSCWLGVQPNRSDPLMRFSFSTKIVEWCRLGLPVVCGETEALRATFGDDALLYHAPEDLEGLVARIREAHRDPEALAARAGRARQTADGIRYDEQIAVLLARFAGARGPI